jgi:alpha-methylacyl-CoA racemase
VALLADADTCVAPVLDIPEVVADPQVAARGAVIQARPPGDAEPFRQLAPLIAGAPRRDIYDLPDPTVTGTEVLLAAAGLSAEDIEALVARGVIA